MNGRLKISLLILPLATLMASPASAGPLSSIIGSMPENSWARINQNAFSDAWTPESRRPNQAFLGSNIDGFSGATWDSNRNDMLIYGGNIGSELGNEVYRFNGTSLEWERASLPSKVKTGGTFPTGRGTPFEGFDDDGNPIYDVNDAPRSGESWDMLTFLPEADRMAVINTSAEGRPFLAADGSRAGPFFWDPSKADSNKVGGADNTDVLMDAEGGHMWENRTPSFGPDGAVVGGVSDSTVIDGKDVVFFGEGGSDDLWKLTVNDPNDSSQDVWEVVGISRTSPNSLGSGAGAYDPINQVFARTTRHGLAIWDLSTDDPGDKLFVVPEILAGPEWTTGLASFGIAFDPVLMQFVLWAGEEGVWLLEPPSDFGADGWEAAYVLPSLFDGSVPTERAKNGVLGKWNYMPSLGGFIGVDDGNTGDVFVYKPTSLTSLFEGDAEIALPASILLMAPGLLMLILGASTAPRNRAGGGKSGI